MGKTRVFLLFFPLVSAVFLFFSCSAWASTVPDVHQRTRRGRGSSRVGRKGGGCLPVSLFFSLQQSLHAVDAENRPGLTKALPPRHPSGQQCTDLVEVLAGRDPSWSLSRKRDAGGWPTSALCSVERGPSEAAGHSYLPGCVSRVYTTRPWKTYFGTQTSVVVFPPGLAWAANHRSHQTW